MIDLKKFEVWFVTGSQHLYGEETLKQVATHSEEIVKWMNAENQVAVSITFKPVVTTPAEILSVCKASNAADNCIGIIAWMHTFSPAKMWING